MGRRHLDRTERTFVRRDVVGRGVGVQKERAEDEERRHLGRAVERHVERRRHLIGGAGEVHLHPVAVDAHADLLDRLDASLARADFLSPTDQGIGAEQPYLTGWRRLAILLSMRLRL